MIAGVSTVVEQQPSTSLVVGVKRKSPMEIDSALPVPPAKLPLPVDDANAADKDLQKALVTTKRQSVPPALDRHMTEDKRVLEALQQRERLSAPCGEYYKCPFIPNDHLFSVDYCKKGSEVLPQMRTLLLKWMEDVCADYGADVEVLPLAITLLDRFLSVEIIYQHQLQSLGTACMWIASKVKMPRPFSGEKLCEYTDGAVEPSPLMVRFLWSCFDHMHFSFRAGNCSCSID